MSDTANGGLTRADVVDLRRFCGYPPAGAAMGDAVGRAVARLIPEEGAVILAYLGQLRTLEQAVPAAGENLDTARAAVWERNANEVRDREGLLRLWSGRLCAALGVESGPMGGSGAPLPGVFVV